MAHDKINLPPWNENMPTTQIHVNAEKMKFSIKDFFSKCDQMHGKLRIWSHLLKKFLIENFILLCKVFQVRSKNTRFTF